MGGVFVFNKKFRCQFADREATRSIGIEDPRGLSPWDIKPNHQRGDLLALFARSERGGEVCFDTWHKHRDGFLFPVRVRLTHTGSQYCAHVRMRGNGVLGDIAEGLEADSVQAGKTVQPRMRYYAAVLRALSLGLGAASVLSPESAEIMLTANSLLARESP